MRIRNRNRGWSLIELTIILIVLSILCAILAPVIGRFVRNARVVRCREDVQALGIAIWMYVEDTAHGTFFVNGNAPGQPNSTGPNLATSNVVSMLVSDGDIPQVRGDLLPTPGGQWQRPVGSGAKVDFLDYHLVTNQPFGNAGAAYRTPLDLDNTSANSPQYAHQSSAGFNSEFAWRGPYMTAPIDPDPWGNRYAVNVEYLNPVANSTGPGLTHGNAGWANDVVVISAGPDGEIDTPYATDGLTAGDDDILYTLSGNSRP